MSPASPTQIVPIRADLACEVCTFNSRERVLRQIAGRAGTLRCAEHLMQIGQIIPGSRRFSEQEAKPRPAFTQTRTTRLVHVLNNGSNATNTSIEELWGSI